MNKNYKYPKTKKLIEQLKPIYKEFKELEDRYYQERYGLEIKASRVTGIYEIEFFYCDNEFAGIGNGERTMELIHREELEN